MSNKGNMADESQGNSKPNWKALLFLGLTIVVGIFLSYGTVKRRAAAVGKINDGYRLVNGRLAKTYYNGISGVRHTEFQYEDRGVVKTLSSRYNIPCSGDGSRIEKEFKPDSIPIAISTAHFGVVVELITAEDFKTANVPLIDVPIKEQACLRTVVNVRNRFQ